MAKMSRAKRFEEVKSTSAKALEGAIELRDELEEWCENMPENLQNSAKAQELDDAINSINEFIDALEEAISTEVEFPGMI